MAMRGTRNAVGKFPLEVRVLCPPLVRNFKRRSVPNRQGACLENRCQIFGMWVRVPPPPLKIVKKTTKNC